MILEAYGHCLHCGEEFKVVSSQTKNGSGNYYCHKCATKVKPLENNYNYSRRELGYTLLMPLEPGDEGHHVTNEFVIGVPAEVHNSIGGSRKKHRTRVLQWLKENDKKKYLKVLCVLAKQ